MSFLYFQFVTLYDKINSVSFLFSAMVALYDHIIRVSLRPHYILFHNQCQPDKEFSWIV